MFRDWSCSKTTQKNQQRSKFQLPSDYCLSNPTRKLISSSTDELGMNYKVVIVRLGPSLNPRPRAWVGPKENTKMGLQTTTHTNVLTTSRVHRKFRVSI